MTGREKITLNNCKEATSSYTTSSTFLLAWRFPQLSLTHSLDAQTYVYLEGKMQSVLKWKGVLSGGIQKERFWRKRRKKKAESKNIWLSLKALSLVKHICTPPHDTALLGSLAVKGVKSNSELFGRQWSRQKKSKLVQQCHPFPPPTPISRGARFWPLRKKAQLCESL